MLLRLSLHRVGWVQSLRFSFSKASNGSPESNSTLLQSTVGLKKLSKNAEMALWASKVISTIETAKHPKQLTDPSLRQILINLQLGYSIPGYKFDEKVRENFLEMFTTGIKPQDWMDQPRIHDAQIGRKQFIFYPTILTTTELFKKLRSFSASATCLSGSYGIGKTVALVLMCYLSRFINIYRCQVKYANEKSNDAKGEELAALKDLENQYNLINDRLLMVPKYWYWTFEKQEFENTDNVDLKNIVLSQATELSKQTIQELRKIESYQEFSKKIKTFYPQNVNHNFIIDHMNFVASIFRKFNQEALQVLNTLKAADSGKYQMLFPLYLQSIQKAIKLKRLVTGFYIDEENQYEVIFNSSMNIQSKLLKSGGDPTIEKPEISFGIKEIYEERLNFQKNLRTPWGKIDFLHYFWFEIAQREMNQQKFLQKVENIYKEQAKQLKLKNYSRFLFIRKYLDNQKFPPLYGKNQVQIRAQIKEVVNKLASKCVTQAIKKLTQFVNKQHSDILLKNSKQTIIDVLCILALELKGLKIENMEFQEQLLAPLLPSKYSIQQIFFTTEHNQQLLPVTRNPDTKTVDFAWHPEEFIEIFQGFCKTNIRDLAFNLYIDKGLTSIFIFLDKYFQTMTIIVFNQNIKVLQKMETFNFQSLKMETYIAKFQVKSSKTFTHFLPKDCTIKNNMSQILYESKKWSGEWILGTPDTESIQQQPSKSRTIDFVLVRYVQKDGIEIIQDYHQIYTFDVTIQKSSLEGKIKKAVKLFHELRQNEPGQLRYQIKHVILCDEEHLKDSKSLNLICNIDYKMKQANQRQVKILGKKSDKQQQLLLKQKNKGEIDNQTWQQKNIQVLQKTLNQMKTYTAPLSQAHYQIMFSSYANMDFEKTINFSHPQYSKIFIWKCLREFIKKKQKLNQDKIAEVERRKWLEERSIKAADDKIKKANEAKEKVKQKAQATAAAKVKAEQKSLQKGQKSKPKSKPKENKKNKK